MFYSDYATRLNTEYSSIVLESGCTEIGPLHSPTQLPNSPPWNMDWGIFFPDGNYAYVYERWWPTGPRIAGRVRKGYRANFSFHYGPASPNRRANGFPARDKANCPAIIRIDCDSHGAHIHFHGEADHITQSRVDGMSIMSADPFEFMRCVLKHRKTGADFDALLNFTVLP